MQTPARKLGGKRTRSRRISRLTEIAHGYIRELYPEQGCGRIETSDGRVIPFHRHSVQDRPFATLTTGTEVRFAIDIDARRLRARIVQVID